MFERQAQECLYTRTCVHCSAYGRCLTLQPPRPVEESPIGGQQLTRPPAADFHLPPGRVVNSDGGPPVAGSPSEYTLSPDAMHVSLFIPNPNPYVNYSHLLGRTEAGQTTALIRQTLYAWSDDRSRWEWLNSVLLPAVDLEIAGGYKVGPSVGLPPEYYDRQIFGRLALGIQVVATNVAMAHRSISGFLVDIDQSFFVSSNVSADLIEHFDDPDAYESRAAYIGEQPIYPITP